MFEVNLQSQVPKYPVVQPDWGGAACCQMAMNGYPPGSTKCYIDQTTIWNYIQAYNKEPGYSPSSWDYGWYADPYAITKTLNDLCPPQYHWIDVSGNSKETVLYTLFRWMANYKYPSLICTFGHDYWAVLVYYRTSDDPRTVTNPTLEKIGYYWPTLSGVQYQEVDGATWMSSPYDWGMPCDGVNSNGESMCGLIWNNNWIGIGEPPEVNGSVRVETISRVGKILISPKVATGIARKYLAGMRREKSELLLSHLYGTQSSQPMLVRELPMDPETQKTKKEVRYYIVPFTQRNEVNRTGAQLSRFSVLVNAYTGRLEQLCVFPKPIAYLSERDVIQIVSRDLHLSNREIRKIQTELVFQPLGPQMTNALPVWQVVCEDLKFFVTQNGLINSTLLYPRFRGA